MIFFTNWNWLVLKSNKIKIIKDTNKLNIDAVKAINLILVNETPLSLLTNIKNTPIIGIKSKDNNNIIKKNKIKYLCNAYNDKVSPTLFINTIIILRLIDYIKKTAIYSIICKFNNL